MFNLKKHQSIYDLSMHKMISYLDDSAGVGANQR